MRLIGFYYLLKPLIPRKVQLVLRRAIAKSRCQRVRDVWPILERAGMMPEGWRGWPDGKQFAVVLTHDVEGPKGIEHCLALADIEEKLGFRSCFNFVPEPHPIDSKIRDELTARGFEIGVHGLRHDGHLFRTWRGFRTAVPKINTYLREWNAVGFRAPSMIRNLKWIGQLEIEWDSSTFDTDPFEPQSEGCETIFPFLFQSRAGRRPYLELPYTLPQDFTLFLLLGETSFGIWKEKLDWIAQRGGMALVNAHPDYMDFRDVKGASSWRYPVSIYADFLRYIKTRYPGEYWHGCPRDLARIREEIAPIKIRRHPLRICLIGYSFFEVDNREQRVAKALSNRGDHVEVVGLERDALVKGEPISGVSVFHIQKRRRDEKNVLTFGLRSLSFLIRSLVFVSLRHLRQAYDVIIVNSPPDFEVFAATIPKLLGAKVVLDIHDLSPEFFLSKFGSTRGRWAQLGYRMLVLMERLACRLADHVIAANDLWGETLVERSVPRGKCSVFCNYLDPGVFYQRHRTRKEDGKIIIIYPGSLNYHQGVDIAIRAFAKVRRYFPGAEFHIYGEGPEKEWLGRVAAKEGVSDSVFFHDPVPLSRIPQIMADADLGVVSKRADIFGDKAYSTKILEYMSQSLPVVVPRTTVDAYYFSDGVVRFFDPGNPDSMARAMIEVLGNRQLRERLIANGLDHVKKTDNWEQKKHEYISLIDDLLEGGCSVRTSLQTTGHSFSGTHLPRKSGRRRLRVCLLGYSFYESDSRRLRYARSLIERGDEVDVIGLRDQEQDRRDVAGGVRILRIQKRRRDEKGLFSYGWRLVWFCVKSFVALGWRTLRRRYDVVQVHSVPDFLVFAALLPKLLGTKVILEIYDIGPELYLSKFNASEHSFTYRLLRFIEKVSTHFADHVIVANHLWAHVVGRRSDCAYKMSVLVNHVDAKLFCRQEKKSSRDGFVVIYHGVFSWHQGLDIAINAFAVFRREFPCAEFHLYGEGAEMMSLEALVRELGLERAVFFHETVPLDQIPCILAKADLGVVGKRPDVFGNMAYSTKILEYMSQGIPAVVPRTKVDTYYFDESVVYFFKPGDVQDMVRAMLEAAQDREKRNRIIENALRYVAGHTWEEKSREYLGIIDCLVNDGEFIPRSDRQVLWIRGEPQ